MPNLLLDFATQAASSIAKLVESAPSGAAVMDESGTVIGIAVSNDYFELMRGLDRTHALLAPPSKRRADMAAEAYPVRSPDQNILAYLFSIAAFRTFQHQVDSLSRLADKEENDLPVSPEDAEILSPEETDAYLSSPSFSPR